MESGLSELLFLGFLMSAGFAAGAVAERFGAPRVAAYVTVGALFSEAALGGWLPARPGTWSDVLTGAALGIIAFLVGAEIDLRRLRREEREVAGVVLGQSLGAVLAITLALGGLSALGVIDASISWAGALVFAAIATATAPAATVAVIEEYKAQGSLTSILLGIIAIDDAISVVVFTVAVGLAGQAPLPDQLVSAGREVLLAVGVGAALGAGLGWFGRRVPNGDLRLPVIIAVVFLNLGLSGRLGYSDLLSNIVLGLTAMTVFRGGQRQWLEPMDHVRETIFLIFFTLAGTHFEPSVFVTALPLIAVYVLARISGKYLGAYAGAAASGAEPKVRRYVGLALLPQAGVAIGLALRAGSSPGLEAISALLLNVVIGSTLLFELTAPVLTKFALQRAGEINGSSGG